MQGIIMADSTLLLGIDGNVFSMFGTVRKELKKRDLDQGIIDLYFATAKLKDYDWALHVSMQVLDNEGTEKETLDKLRGSVDESGE